MQLDVRIPMGWLFLILGILLTGYGFTADPAIYVKHSLGQNVNLIWGGIFMLFGLATLALAYAERSKRTEGLDESTESQAARETVTADSEKTK